MSLSTRTLLTAAALAAAAIAPSAAHAAEGFTAVTADGQVAKFHSDSRPALIAPVKVTGLAAGERIVGLDRAPSRELLGLTSAGRIVDVDANAGKVTPKFAAVTSAVDPNAALTFAVAPDGASARIVTAGRDVSINLTTGAATNGPGLTYAPGDKNAGVQAAPALDYAKDGSLIGIAGAQGAFAKQAAPGAATLQTLTAAGFPVLEPLRATVASDGSVWVTANFSAKANRPKQSRVVRYDPATGQITGQNGVFFQRQLVAIADDGPVADDKSAPKATLSGHTLKRHVTKGQGLGQALYTGLNVKSNEAGQVVGSVRLRGDIVGFTIATRDTAGTFKLEFASNKKDDAALRRAARAHLKVLVHLSVNDFAGNKHVFDRSMRLGG
jgi:Cu/Ag efflux protein CusF